MNNPSTKVSTKVFDKKYNLKIEYKLIKNKDLLKSRLSEISAAGEKIRNSNLAIKKQSIFGSWRYWSSGQEF